MSFWQTSQALRGGFRGDITLRHPEHLITYHELADRCRAQQRRIEMCMEQPLWVSLSIERSLVKSHGVGKGDLKQIVVACGDRLQDGGEGRCFGGGQFREAG